jgi:hypothetical protein
MGNVLHTYGLIELLGKMAQDYTTLVKTANVPSKLSYTVADSQENREVERSSRTAALKSMQQPLVKLAFDTRKINSETDRNPRANLQTWVRSEPFINEETQKKIETFGHLVEPLYELKQTYGTQPEWHNSYARVLCDTVDQVLRISNATVDVSAPQLAYLEQLMYMRYRLNMDEIKSFSVDRLKQAIISKDEVLLKRGRYLQDRDLVSTSSSFNIAKDGNQTQEAICNAIFGSNFRREGEKTATRTITITITDHATE